MRLPATSAKSRRRRSSRLAMRGVPRLRGADLARGLGRRSRMARMPRRAVDDLGEGRDVVEVEPQRDAEAAVQRLREQARPRRRPDQREGREVDLHRARHRAFADQDVEAEVLHRGIEDLLDRGREPVDLVDEEDVPGLEVRQDARRGLPRARSSAPPSCAARRPSRGRRCGRASSCRGPGGPVSRTWSSGSPRPRAAARKTREVFPDFRLADVLARASAAAASARRRCRRRAPCRRGSPGPGSSCGESIGGSTAEPAGSACGQRLSASFR